MKSAKMLGVNPNAIRERNDYYATHPDAITLALPFLQEMGLQSKVWECACGEGHISKVLEANGYEVRSSDLIDRGFGEVQDFLQCEETFDGDILTNPPFKHAQEFIEHGMNLLKDGSKMFLFLKIQFLESRARKELFKKYPPKAVLVYSERQKCAKEGKFELYANSNTLFYMWLVFEKGYQGETVLKWI